MLFPNKIQDCWFFEIVIKVLAFCFQLKRRFEKRKKKPSSFHRNIDFSAARENYAVFILQPSAVLLQPTTLSIQ